VAALGVGEEGFDAVAGVDVPRIIIIPDNIDRIKDLCDFFDADEDPRGPGLMKVNTQLPSFPVNYQPPLCPQFFVIIPITVRIGLSHPRYASNLLQQAAVKTQRM
jgi:hypothetical protein